MAHTPGSWKFRKHLGGEEGEVIAQDVRFDTDFLYIAEIFGHYQDDECAANGRLIAAAPDLLAACKSALVWFERWTSDEDEPPASWGWELKGELAAAIAKVKGSDGA